MKIKRLLIIPARSGSKRIKNKNIKNFVGKPIIYYPINTAIKSKLFTKIHVSTDSKKISKLAESFGVMRDFLRPKNLSNDKASLFPVFKFVVDKYLLLGQKFDEVWCILPCSPFLDKNDLVSISSKSKKLKKPILTISPYPAPLNWSFEVKKHRVINVNQKKMRNDKLSKKKHFYDAGQVYCLPSHYLDKKNFNFKDNISTYRLPLVKSVDIDTVEDWKLAETIYRGMYSKK
jgi:pseudaminic acid cytidylyltransferase